MDTLKYATLLAERVYDVLWHNEALKKNITINDITSYLVKDIVFHLERFQEETQNGHK